MFGKLIGIHYRTILYHAAACGVAIFGEVNDCGGLCRGASIDKSKESMHQATTSAAPSAATHSPGAEQHILNINPFVKAEKCMWVF